MQSVVEDLAKTFRVARAPGLLGAVRGLVRCRRRKVAARTSGTTSASLVATGAASVVHETEAVHPLGRRLALTGADPALTSSVTSRLRSE